MAKELGHKIVEILPDGSTLHLPGGVTLKDIDSELAF
jgi:hypothetical protein